MRRHRKVLWVVTWIYVATIATAAAARAADEVKLKAGDVLVGKVVQQTDQVVVMDHPVLGHISVPRAKIASVLIASASKPAAAATPSAKPQPKPEAKPQPKPAPAKASIPAPAANAPNLAKKPEPSLLDKILKEWKIRVALGANYRDSNSHTTDLHANIHAKYADKTDRWDLGGELFYQRAEGQVSREDYHLTLRKDWLLPDSPWFFFGQCEYDKDNFKTWDYRISAHGGLGYDIKDIIGISAQLRAGGGVTRDFGGPTAGLRPESLFSSAITWNLDKRNKISGSVEIYPSLNSDSDYRLRTQADWTFKFTDNVGLSIGYWNEYDSAVPAGFDRSDTRVFGSVVFDF